jgi:hypothetical protein
MAVTNDMISTPNGSSLLSMAENPPATANANVPRISIRFKKLEYMFLKIRARMLYKKNPGWVTGIF